ncbi:MAG: energy-coupling factor transporter ATPase [Clostridia bacterium]|nr:energy-coupling factor transporter ATPase [Oscillospiraceae bacterium]MBR4893354.1 energy-coupling factor transporter ATPase [Clostridia bacterium]
MDNIIETKDLTYGYNEKEYTTVFEKLNISVKKGEFLCILGHNGSGKSTLAKHFNGILLPSGGVCYVNGIDTKDEKKIFDVRKNVGMVFQNPDNQLVATTVEDDVAFALENLGVEPEVIRERVDEALKSVGLFNRQKDAPHKLSGGQKQRVAIAGVIALRPQCIVLDEPTAMLDPSGRKEVIDTLIRLNKEYSLTIILITHYMEEAIEADRVVVLDNGEILLDDSPKKIFENVALIKSVGLDVPQTTELLYELYKDGVKVSFENLTVDECVMELTKLLEGTK